MLSAAEITSMTSVVLSALDQTAVVQRGVRTADGQQGFTEVWATIYATMPCRIGGNPGSERVVAEQLLGNVQKPLRYPSTYTILSKDRILVGGITYQVENAPGLTSYGVLYSAMIERIEEAG